MDPKIVQRRYDLDWLRVLAFSAVFFYHSGRFDDRRCDMNKGLHNIHRVRVPVAWIAGLLVAMAALAGCQWIRPANTIPEPDYWPTDGWQAAPPETAGFRSDKMAEGLLAIRQEGIPIHSLTIIRHGQVAVDAYFYPYDGSTVHDMASVTKSVMTTLIGIAADQGKLDLDDPMVSFFPDRTIANLDDRKQRITVAHLASMSSGLECTEANEATQQEMMASEDWVQFALDLPVAWEPGTHFVYCNPAIHLLSPILQQATGMTALEFARVNLFEPLGIHDTEWTADPQGYNYGWGDLFLKPQDAAKIGFLWLHQGKWEDRQIVSAEWVAAASQRRMTGTGRDEDYGYAWWISNPKEDVDFVQAAGTGGQLIKVLPELDLIFVTTGGGFEVDQIDPYVIAAIGDFQQPLAANPAGVAALEAAVQEVSLAPAPLPAASLPEIASAISGKTYAFEAHPLLEWFRLDFASEAEATMEFSVLGEDAPRVVQIGLDGIYRTAPDGALPGLGRGYWEDDTTFVVDYSTLPSLEHFTFRLTFDGKRVVLDIAERIYGMSATLEGFAQEP
jgi:CubicO group peptidase (beta-lactamase class C family)